MVKNKILLSLIVSFILVACTSEYPASDDAKAYAIQDAQNLIHDPNAAMPDWYQAQLEPSFSTSWEEKERGLFKERIEKVEPKISSSLVWMIMAVFTIVYGGVCFYWWFFFNRKGFDDDYLKSKCLIYYLILGILPFLFILPIKVIGFLVLNEGRYIPWHFIVFMTYILETVLVIFSILFQKALVSLSILITASRHKKAEQASNLVIESLSMNDLKQHFADIRQYILLLSEEHNHEDDIILNQIHESIDSISFDEKKIKARVKEHKNEIKLLLAELKNKGYGNNYVYKRLSSRI